MSGGAEGGGPASGGRPTDSGARRRDLSRNIATLLLRHGVTAPTTPEIRPEPETSGTLSVTPDHGTAGAWGTWTVRYVVGEEPIEDLGGLRIQLPEAWHAGIRNSAFRLQASAPREPNFVAATASRPGVVVQTFVELESDLAIDKSGRWSNLSDRAGYYSYVTRVIVRHGRLEPGDTLSVAYGETAGGSRGFRAGINRAGPLPIFVAVDHDGSGRHRLHRDQPTLTLHAGPPADLFAVAPSDVVAGEPFALRLAVIDEYANPSAISGARLALEVVEGSADVPSPLAVPDGRAWIEADCVARSPGVLRIRVTESRFRLDVITNPARVHASAPPTRTYWGDIHSHTEISNDGVGSGTDAYDYARHVAALDFYSRTDHNAFFEAGGIADFDAYTRLADERNEPGRFATLHGAEVSFGAPYGHHNVYFRAEPIMVADEYSATLPELWKSLAASQALTIPHHTMKMPSPIDWSDGEDPGLRRNFEIFSAHGLSEAFDPYHPLAVDQSLFTNASLSQRAGMSAQRAWEQGLRLSTIASSDDHRAQPGLPHQGVVAVLATGLTRAEVFDALHARRTYATTGARIVLDFSAGGIEMGGMGRPAGGWPVAIRVSAVGTDVIDLVEVLRHVDGRPGFAVIAELAPLERQFEWAFDDDPGPGPALYYARVRQRGRVRGLLSMAWSSPVWIDTEE